MNQADAAERIIKLRSLINEYRYSYHVLNESIMSEEAADSLKHELAQLEATYPSLITADSPTQRVAGEVLSGFRQIKHQRRMISLNDVFSKEEVEAWLKRINKAAPLAKVEYFTDIKMDGLACALIYQDGILVRGVTRGDGFVGEDVTVNIRTIDSVPLSLRSSIENALFLKEETEIRGEIVMYKRDFNDLNQKRASAGQPLFANPRNTAAGTIRQLDPGLVADRPLHFRAYDLLRTNELDVPFNDYAYQILNSLGFSTNKMATVFTSIDQVMDFAKAWEEKRLTLDFNTDGLVIKVNDRALFSRLGIVGKAPRGAVAFKYAAEQATTIVKDIFISIGRTGSATPVAVLEAVVIAGSTVQMATLHNESEVKRKDIRIGDSVIIHKAGDIIPEVVQSLPQLRIGKEKIFQMPEKCPECGSLLIKQKAADAAWRCPNYNCPSRSWKQIQHYASKEAVDIEGLGEKNVIALLENGLIKDAADIYSLNIEQLEQLDRFAAISANKLVHAIQRQKQPQLGRFIYALGIRHVGVQTAIDLAIRIHDMDSLTTSTLAELTEIEGIGEVVAEAIVEYFAEPRHKLLLNKFKELGVWPESVEKTTGELKGTNFVVSGTLNSMSRDQVAQKIRSLGGTFQSSVAKDTDYLVVGINPGASKITKANKLSTKIIEETELMKILGQ